MEYHVVLFGESQSGKTTLLEKCSSRKRSSVIYGEENCVTLESNGEIISLWVREFPSFPDTLFNPNAAIIFLNSNQRNGGVNIRSAMSFLSRIKVNYGNIPVIVCVNKNDELYLDENWVLVQPGVKIGWISCKYGKEVDNVFYQLVSLLDTKYIGCNLLRKEKL